MSKESATFIIASKKSLARAIKVPELLAIDKEIGHPYMTEPLLYNSQAWSRRLELPWVIERIGPIEGLSILDVGSGLSALPLYLARHGARVVSIEPQMIERLPTDGVQRMQSALPRLPLRDSSFDVVCCVSVLEHLPFDIDVSFREMCRVARSRVIVTFDIALSPLAIYGLSPFELRAITRALGTKAIFPKDILTPADAEKRLWIVQVAVCMLDVKKSGNGWPDIYLSRKERMLVRMHRKMQNLAGFSRSKLLAFWDRVSGN